MTIRSVSFQPCEMPLEDAGWRYAQGGIPVNRGYVVRLEAEDGTAGYGYAQAFQEKGTTFESLPALLERFAPLVTGREPFDIETILLAMDRSLKGSSPAKAGIDCALHDLAARQMGIPLYRMLGGKVREAIPLLRILALKSPEETAQQAAALVEEGYRYLKIKVDGDIERDVARVREVRAAVGPEVHLTVDANQSYTVKQAVTAIGRMAAFGIDIAEQPVPAGDLKGLELVTRTVPVAVEADESASSLEDVLTLVSNHIVDSISLKIPPLGGLRNTLAAARICQAGNIPCRMGASFCSQLLQSHAMHLAAALPNLGYACELGEFLHFRDDPFAGLEVDGGMLLVPDDAGSGVLPKR